jgi:uncharacterized membrane protein YkoI
MELGASLRRLLRQAGSLLPATGAALLLACVPAMAKEKGQRDAPPVQNIREPSRLAPGGVSLDHVISQVEKRYKARVVRVDHQQVGGRLVYVLRLLSDDGRVSTVRVDAETGGVI